MKYLNIFIDYIKGSRLELKKVNWPTKQDTMRFTAIIIGLSLAVAVFLGSLDFVFAALLRLIV
ncbi:MAG: preprotein translocase subunit SecE [Patescibacteria group bacterium]